MLDGSIYKMWYGGHDNSLVMPKIGYAESADGITWTRPDLGIVSYNGNTNNNIIMAPVAGTWANIAVGNPTVLREGGIYKMWFAGNQDHTIRLGYATSTDGIHWTQYSGNPVISPGSFWPQITDIHDTTVVNDGGTYRIWYSGIEYNYLAKIGYAYSSNGISWTNHNGPVVTPSSSGWDAGEVYNANVVGSAGAFEMWYAGEPSVDSWTTRIGYAMSTDGITWVKHGVVLDLGASGEPDSYRLNNPFIFKESDGTSKMYYSGATTDNRARILLATSGLSQPKKVTVSIVEVRATDTMDPADAADFFAKVTIADKLGQSSFMPNDNDIYPLWDFSQTVYDSSASIRIEIWDNDGSSSEHVDIDGDTDDVDLDVRFDLTSEVISGDVSYGYSKGGGDSRRAEIWFNIGLEEGDRDGDGLFDSWEQSGIHMDNDGIIDMNLASEGADPDHEDIFMEIDWMEDISHTHRPLAGVTDAVNGAFANAPISNLDGTTGVSLHIVMSNAVAHQETIAMWADFDTIKSENYNQDLRFVYHYCLFAHLYSNFLGSSGYAELPGNDLLVTLGWGANGVGSFREQSGTLIHEFGHNLNLRHGGGDDVNYKPNYLSIMNYRFQFSGIPSSGRLDYSRSALANLNEESLDEAVGIQDGSDHTAYFAPDGHSIQVPGSGPIDWDDDNHVEAEVRADINNDGSFGTLVGYNDWSNMICKSRGSPGFKDGVHLDSQTTMEAVPYVYHQSMAYELFIRFFEGPIEVAALCESTWTVTYMLTNSGDDAMRSVTVKDHFAANLEVELVSVSKGTYTRDASKSGLQERMLWSLDRLLPGESAVLKIELVTGKNPAGKQEFTSPGFQDLSSCATVKWADEMGHGMSMESDGIGVFVRNFTPSG
jgi:hypothetical protein